MERTRLAVLEDFASHLDDALVAAVGRDPDAAVASAEELAKSLRALEDWRRQYGPGNPPDPASAETLLEVRQKAYRLACTVRHAAWVRQGLRDIGGVKPADCYERDGRVQAAGETRLAVDG